MAKLSDSQRRDLRYLSDPNHHISNRGCTNATLSALERRGFAKLHYVPSEHTANHQVLRWFITDAGREALKPNATANTTQAGH